MDKESANGIGTGALKSPSKRPSLPSRISTSITIADIEYRGPALIAEFDLLRSSLSAAEEERDENLEEVERLKTLLEKSQQDHLRLEEEVVSREEQHKDEVAQLRNAITSLKSSNKHSDSDRQKLLEEREQLTQKHEMMTVTIQRLHQRSTSVSPVSSQNDKTDGDLPFAHSRTNSNNNLLSLQMTNSAKDRHIQALELQVKELEVELQAYLAQCDPRILHLEDEIRELRKEISILREDNESYQTLLQDKTMTGEFAQSQFMQSTASLGKYQSVRGDRKRPDLAAELQAVDDSSSVRSGSHEIETAGREQLESEVLKLQETNKALTLYINTIVARLLADGSEHLLAKDARDMQPANMHKSARQVSEPSSAGFLQRTKTVLMRKSLSSTTEDTAPAESKSPAPVFKDVFSTADGSSTDTTAFSRSAIEHSPSPSRSTVDTSSSLGRRAISIDSRSPSKSDGKQARGLRPLQSAAAADQISTREARRLSAQYAAPPLMQHKDGKSLMPSEDNSKNRRSSWMGWLSSKSETPVTIESNTDAQSSRSASLADLRPLKEIDAEIEHESEQSMTKITKPAEASKFHPDGA